MDGGSACLIVRLDQDFRGTRLQHCLARRGAAYDPGFDSSANEQGG
jgi:hypothetical protein